MNEKILNGVKKLSSFYEIIGGMAVIEKLVDDFYFIMSTDPAAKECFKTHEGRDIGESAEKLKLFLSGWLGGPQLYLEKHGHPRLRMRHAPFVISQKEAEQWLYCMNLAFQKSKISPEIHNKIMDSLEGVALMLRNST